MIILLTVLINFFNSRWAPIALLCSAIGIIYTNVMGIFEKISAIIPIFDNSMATPMLSVVGVNVAPFSVMNYIVPLDVGLSLIAIYIPYYMLAVSLRVIKSFIPTVA